MLTPSTGDVQIDTYLLDNLTILENLSHWILKTSLSPKDQRILYILFSNSKF